MLRAGLIFLLALGLVACSAEADTETVTEHHLEGARDVFDAEEHIATPSHVEVTDNGRFYVLDPMNHRVLVLSPEGEVLHTIGREGEGPGEFTMPRDLVVAGDSLRVWDARAMRVQVFTPEGHYLRSYNVSDVGTGGHYAAFWPDGELAIPTLGYQDDRLIQHMDIAGSEADLIGTVVTEPIEIMDFEEMSAAASAGRIPEPLRHWTLPIPTADGGLWLILQADALVRHYDEEGVLQQEFALDVPEVEAIREAFFESNKDMPDHTLMMLTTVEAGAAVGNQLWLLMNIGQEETPRLLIYAEDGTLLHRLVIPEASRGDDFTLSPDRSTLYLAAREDARLLAVDLPEEVASR